MYRQAIKNNIAQILAYRVDFILNSLISLLSNILLPLVTIIVYSKGLRFPGWNFHEALLIQAIFMMSLGIAKTFFFGLIETVMMMVREGTFDLVLIKPRGIMLTSMAMSFDISNIHPFIAGAVFFVYSSCNLTFSIEIMLKFLFLFAAGIAVIVGCSLFMAATAFKWVGNGRIFEIFDSVTTFGKYPATIYPKWLKTFVFYIVPVALIGFIPAAALLGKDDAAMYISALSCIVFLAGGVAVFKYMAHKYTSAGG